MAKREAGETAGGRLETLRAQIGALWARKRELNATTETPDSGDPLAWAARAGAAGAEVAAIDRALPALEAEARAAEAQLKAAHDAEQAAAAARMRGELPGKLADVVKAVDALGLALDAVAQHERAIRALGGWVAPTHTAGLRQAVNSFRGSMRSNFPELVGLPPAPTRAEQLISDARAELARRLAALEDMRRLDEGPRGELASDKKRLIADGERAVDLARQRVKDAEEAAKTPRVRIRPEPAPAPQVVTRADPEAVGKLGPDRPRASYWED